MSIVKNVKELVNKQALTKEMHNELLSQDEDKRDRLQFEAFKKFIFKVI